MSFGWSPFSYGGWFQDPFFGNTFIGSAPWGWLPYHYGGWIFSPAYGWVWAPTGFGYGGPVHYRPVTAVWLRNGSTLGIVPLHPADKSGKTALNLNQGVFPVQNSQVLHTTLAPEAGQWAVLKKGPTEVISSSLTASAPPSRVSRTVVAGASGTRVVTLGRDSSISYDPREHRYVNNANPAAASTNELRAETSRSNGAQPTNNPSTGAIIPGETSARSPVRAGTPGSPAVPQAPTSSSARDAAPPRPPAVPAPARSGGSSSSGGNFSSGGSTWGGGSRSGGSASGSSAGSSGHPSASGGGGGHPH